MLLTSHYCCGGSILPRLLRAVHTHWSAAYPCCPVRQWLTVRCDAGSATRIADLVWFCVIEDSRATMNAIDVMFSPRAWHI